MDLFLRERVYRTDQALRQRPRASAERAQPWQERRGRLRAPAGIFRGGPRNHHEQLAETRPDRGLGLTDRLVGAVQTQGDRPAERRRIAPDLRAPLVERAREGGRGLEARVLVPDVGVTRDEAEHAGAFGTDPDRRVGPLQGLRLGDRVGELVEAPGKGRAWLAPEELHRAK